MQPYSISQLATLNNAEAHAISTMEYWFDATGSHEYYYSSLTDCLGFLTESLNFRAQDDVTNSNTRLTIACLNFNSM